MRVVDGYKVGHWTKLVPEFGAGPLVKQQIPQIYDAYARIFHPAIDLGGRRITWSEVALRLGKTPHRGMQWNSIIGCQGSIQSRLPDWLAAAPALGELDLQSLNSLCEVLEDNSQDSKNVFYGLSTIHSGVRNAFDTAPMFQLPQRDFVILSGPLSAIATVGFAGTSGTSVKFREPEEAATEAPMHSSSFTRISPNLIWPSDHNWFVATEYEFDSTLIGGSSILIADLIDQAHLETWIIQPEDSLSYEGDRIN
jgi:hypothetical protein